MDPKQNTCFVPKRNTCFDQDCHFRQKKTIYVFLFLAYLVFTVEYTYICHEYTYLRIYITENQYIILAPHSSVWALLMSKKLDLRARKA